MSAERVLVIIELIVLAILIVINIWISVMKRKGDTKKAADNERKREEVLRKKLDNPRQKL